MRDANMRPQPAIVRAPGARPSLPGNRRRVAFATLLPLIVLFALVPGGCLERFLNPSPTSSPTPPAPSPTTGSSSAPTGPSPTPADGSGSAGAPVLLAMVELGAEDPMPGGTFVVIENQGSVPTDVGCWRLRTSLKELAIAKGTRVPPRGGLRLFFARGDIGNPDRLELRDAAGRVIDSTPDLHDPAGDDQLFSRAGDGWELGRPPPLSPLVDGGFIDPAGC